MFSSPTQDRRFRLSTITHHPDEAGLLGGLYLAPSWILEGYDAILAADIGGTNLRVGIVEIKMKKGAVSKPNVWKYLHWRHKDEGPTRDGRIHGHEPLFIMHNDAVVQGLSECQSMDEVKRWRVFTIGTGLGNARFTNRK